jgi:hypothetical protein
MSFSANWGDIATWFTGIITLGLFIIGFLQIRTERMSRIKNDKETLIRNKREQAEHFSAWISIETPDGLRIAILNNSSHPVYQVIINVAIVGQAGDLSDLVPDAQVCIAVAPPGQGFIVVAANYHGMHRRAGVEIAFRDAAGNNWVRKATGQLLEIDTSTIEYYDVPLPTGWINLETE